MRIELTLGGIEGLIPSTYNHVFKPTVTNYSVKICVFLLGQNMSMYKTDGSPNFVYAG